MDEANKYDYYQDHDDPTVIVRTWLDEESGDFKGELWGFKKKKWFESPRLALTIKDDIYEHVCLSKADVERITGVKQ